MQHIHECRDTGFAQIHIMPPHVYMHCVAVNSVSLVVFVQG